MPSSSSQPVQAKHVEGVQRSLLSLALVVHLFFVMVSMAAVHAPSQLVTRVLRRFAFYTQLLNLDLDFKPYYLTHATEADVDHRLEVLPVGEEDGWVHLGVGSWPGGQQHHRHQRLARVMAYVAEEEALAAQMASAVGEHFLRRRGVEPEQVRVRRHLLQDWEVIRRGTVAERDPDSDLYFSTPYAARCVLLQDGRVQVVRIESAGQVAEPNVSSPASEQP